jgi:hypothetical protein
MILIFKHLRARLTGKRVVYIYHPLRRAKVCYASFSLKEWVCVDDFHNTYRLDRNGTGMCREYDVPLQWVELTRWRMYPPGFRRIPIDEYEFLRAALTAYHDRREK